MEGFISVLSSSINLIVKLVEPLNEYQKKKETKLRFVRAIEEEKDMYLNSYGELVNFSEKSLIPFLQDIGEEEINFHHINELVRLMTPLPLLTSQGIDSFINIAKACYQISSLEGLMKYLEKYDVLIYDFVIVMKNAYDERKNQVTIDANFFRFFKSCDNKLFEGISINDITKVAEDFSPIMKTVERINKKIKEIAKKNLINRKIRKNYRKNHRIFEKSSNNMKVEKEVAIGLSKYLPSKLLPIMLMFEESYSI